jgi:predicted DNA-binding transcriptional regulator AlpA
MSTKFLRKAQVAERYQVHERSIDRWKTDGRLPAPLVRGRIPLWNEAELDAMDRVATTKMNQRN